MYHLTIDYETRSPVDIKACGAFEYAANPNTEVLMLAVKKNDEKPLIWIPEKFRSLCPTELSDSELSMLVRDAEIIIAHNSFFERSITRFHMKGILDPIPIEKIRDTAAQARMCSLPASLDSAGKALDIEEKKDSEGHTLMLRVSKPRKFVKKERVQIGEELGLDEKLIDTMQRAIYDTLKCGRIPDTPNWEKFLIYKLSPEDFQRTADYCKQDVESEWSFYKACPKLPDSEVAVWQATERLNDRGIPIDTETCERVVKMLEKFDSELEAEALRLADGEVTSIRSNPSILQWLKKHNVRTGISDKCPEGVEVKSIDKQNVADMLAGGQLPDKVRRFLEIRQMIGGSAVTKYIAMLNTSRYDGRAHGAIVYHGAGTGRESGSLFQPQNLPRLSAGNLNLPDWIKQPEYHICDSDVALLATGDVPRIQKVWKSPRTLATDCLRAMIKAPKGYKFLVSDWSAIEARALAWIAGEEWVLDGFRHNLDIYKVSAAGIFGIKYEEVDGGGKGRQRQIGKVAVLAAGYGGGVNAFLRFGADRLGMTEQEMADTVKAWRESRPKTTSLWYALNRNAVQCVSTRMPVLMDHGVAFVCEGNFLKMRLPSGRFLYYPKPKLEEVEMGWSTPENPQFKELVTSMTMTATSKVFCRRALTHVTYTENLVQALCRDLLVEARQRLEDNGYPAILDVHDEIICQVPENFGNIDEYNEIMCQLPAWAEGLPMKAEGDECYRYHK